MKYSVVTRRTVLIVILGNLFWFALGLLLVMVFVQSGVTPIGEFVRYTGELLSQSKSVDAVIEDPQWGLLLDRFQFFLGMILEPLTTLVVAFICAMAQKDKKLLTTYLATLVFPTFLALSYYYSNSKVIAVMGLDLNGAVPIMSLFANIIAASVMHKIGCRLRGRRD